MNKLKKLSLKDRRYYGHHIEDGLKKEDHFKILEVPQLKQFGEGFSFFGLLEKVGDSHKALVYVQSKVLDAVTNISSLQKIGTNTEKNVIVDNDKFCLELVQAVKNLDGLLKTNEIQGGVIMSFILTTPYSHYLVFCGNLGLKTWVYNPKDVSLSNFLDCSSPPHVPDMAKNPKEHNRIYHARCEAKADKFALSTSRALGLHAQYKSTPQLGENKQMLTSEAEVKVFDRNRGSDSNRVFLIHSSQLFDSSGATNHARILSLFRSNASSSVSKLCKQVVNLSKAPVKAALMVNFASFDDIGTSIWNVAPTAKDGQKQHYKPTRDFVCFPAGDHTVQHYTHLPKRAVKGRSKPLKYGAVACFLLLTGDDRVAVLAKMILEGMKDGADLGETITKFLNLKEEDRGECSSSRSRPTSLAGVVSTGEAVYLIAYGKGRAMARSTGEDDTVYKTDVDDESPGKVVKMDCQSQQDNFFYFLSIGGSLPETLSGSDIIFTKLKSSQDRDTRKIPEAIESLYKLINLNQVESCVTIGCGLLDRIKYRAIAEECGTTKESIKLALKPVSEEKEETETEEEENAKQEEETI